MGLIFRNGNGNVMHYITKISCNAPLLLNTFTLHGYLLLDIWSQLPGVNMKNTYLKSGIFVTFVETDGKVDSILHIIII